MKKPQKQLQIKYYPVAHTAGIAIRIQCLVFATCTQHNFTFHTHPSGASEPNIRMTRMGIAKRNGQQMASAQKSKIPENISGGIFTIINCPFGLCTCSFPNKYLFIWHNNTSEMEFMSSVFRHQLAVNQLLITNNGRIFLVDLCRFDLIQLPESHICYRYVI